MFENTIDCRYERQNYEIPITFSSKEFNLQSLEEIKEKFHAEHEKLYGYHDEKKEYSDGKL